MSALDPVPADQTWTLTRDLPAPPETVYRALTDGAALHHWYGPEGWSVDPDSVELVAEPGGVRSFKMVFEQDPAQVAPIHGRHAAVQPHRLLEIHEFIPDHTGAPSEHVVVLRCEFTPVGDSASLSGDDGAPSTRLTLTQGPLPADVHDHARSAWVSTLDRLAAYLAQDADDAGGHQP